MKIISLPDRLRSPFIGLANALLRVFPDAVIAMGGGSLLEARWDHRVSTDLDLFVSPQNLAKTFDGHRGSLYLRLVDAMNDAGVSINAANRVQRREQVFLSGTCGDGTPWSLAEMHYMNPNHPMLDSVEGTGIRAADVTEIFMGKIVGRAHVAGGSKGGISQPIPIRDCYDICICAALAPHALRGIFDVLPPAARTRIATNFRTAPRDLHMRDTKPVISPTWVVALEGVAERIGEAVASKDLGRIPAAKKLNAPARNRQPAEDRSHGCQP